MVVVRFTLAVLVLWIGVAATALSAELAVNLSRDQIADDETVELTVAYSGDGDLALDLSVLQSDFTVLSESRNHHTRIVNGRISVRQILKLDLAPERTGSLTIPSLQFGGARSNPLTLIVKAAEDVQPAERTHFIEVEVSNPSPWVQEQVIYTVRIFQRTPVIDGSLTEPEADGVALERLGTDRSYRDTRDGVTWDVHERRYALFPQRSGRLTLGAVRLLARVATDSNDSSSFFNRQTRQIRLRGRAIELDVRPAPDGVAWWLPASALSVTANWLDATAPRVGDPVTLELTVTAHGTQASQLPTLRPAESASARLYPSQSETGFRALASGLVSQRRVRQQIVPTQAGPLELGAVSLEWYSLLDGQFVQEEVAIPVLDVQAAALPADSEADSAKEAVEPNTTPVPQGAPQTDTNPDASTEPLPSTVSSSVETLGTRWAELLKQSAAYVSAHWVVLMWPVSGALLLLCALKLQQRYQRAGPSRRALLGRAANAMRAGDRQAVQQNLLAWARTVWDNPPRHLLDIAARLRQSGCDPVLTEQIVQFDKRLHGPADGDWQDPTLLRLLRRVRVQREGPVPSTQALPSLGAAWSHLDHVVIKKSE